MHIFRFFMVNFAESLIFEVTVLIITNFNLSLSSILLIDTRPKMRQIGTLHFLWCHIQFLAKSDLMVVDVKKRFHTTSISKD